MQCRVINGDIDDPAGPLAELLHELEQQQLLDAWGGDHVYMAILMCAVDTTFTCKANYTITLILGFLYYPLPAVNLAQLILLFAVILKSG